MLDDLLKETEMVWLHVKITWHGEDNSAVDSKRNKEDWKTEGDGKTISKNGLG